MCLLIRPRWQNAPGCQPRRSGYYESIGLLKPAPRATSGHRRYSEQTIEELRIIKKAQALGFSLDEVAQILQLSRSGKKLCAQVLSLGHEHLAVVNERIRQLQAF